jgi:hypothetical protein
VTVPLTVGNGSDVFPFSSPIYGYVGLPTLSEGKHNLTVYAEYNYTDPDNPLVGLDSSTVSFTVAGATPAAFPLTTNVLLAIGCGTAVIVVAAVLLFGKRKPQVSIGRA